MNITGKELTKKELLMEVMYNMFLDGALPTLDMEDYAIMWLALMECWHINMPEEQFEAFLEAINCQASEKYSYFKGVFEEFFN